MRWYDDCRRFVILSCACVWVFMPWAGVHAHASETRKPWLAVAETVVDGADPGIRVSGLSAGEVVRVHVLRSPEKWQNEGGRWQRVRQPLHAYADFAANEEGVVMLDTAAPVADSYARADPLALLRNGYRFGDPALKAIRTFDRNSLNSAPANRVFLKVERGGEVVAESDFRLIGEPEGLTFEEAAGPGWQAAYAYPADGTKLVPVVTLHGSEGGSVEKARGRAAQFAAQGFAALAVNYFTQPYEPIEGVPTKHIEIKIELIASARDWLETRPEVNASRLALYGVSKGAEFALIAASEYDWISRVVAVVPSDIVWEGYAEDAGQSTARSSWSLGGRPIPFMPLFSFDPKQEGLYRTNTERYERSRRYFADRAAAARIPIEKTKARVLLLASDRDEVWASGEMARNVAERLAASNKGGQVKVKVYPSAGHEIAGTGTFPIRLYAEQSPNPEAKDIVDEGEAAADAWRRTVRFLKE